MKKFRVKWKLPGLVKSRPSLCHRGSMKQPWNFDSQGIFFMSKWYEIIAAFKEATLFLKWPKKAKIKYWMMWQMWAT